MKSKTLILIIATALFLSCNTPNQGKSTTTLTTVNTTEIVSQNLQEEAYTLMKNNCYACHNPNAASHDNIIAPPFKAVKMHYTRTYDTKEEFVNAMVNWVQNPTEEKALMRGAVRRFNLMPKMPLDKSVLEKIATYIYKNDVDKPTWMDQHMKEEHGKGKGKNKKSKRS